MIEIEKKFLLSAEDEARLLDGAEFKAEKTITDSYYDNETFELTRKDFWLRERDGRFELKVPLGDGSAQTHQYRELETDTEICQALGLTTQVSLAEAIESAGYAVFCRCTTTRRKYSKQDFTLDLDEVIFADTEFHYMLAEVELLVENETDIQEANDRILAFANAHRLPTDVRVLGKVVAYLQEVRPDHYRALQEARVLK